MQIKKSFIDNGQGIHAQNEEKIDNLKQKKIALESSITTLENKIKSFRNIYNKKNMQNKKLQNKTKNTKHYSELNGIPLNDKVNECQVDTQTVKF